MTNKICKTLKPKRKALTINASPTSVPMAMAIMKRKISWYALNRVSGTKAIPTNPHNDIIVIETTAAIQANNHTKINCDKFGEVLFKKIFYLTET